MNTLRLLVAALCLLCVKSETLTQPASVTVQPGHPLSISCTVSYSVSSYYTTYIRHPAGKTLEWIGYYRAGGTLYLKDSLKNKFNINVDSSSNTVTLSGQNMQPEDSAVYYCARYNINYFDYWGKGTMVTVTSATSQGPDVFPVMPCNTESQTEITLACLAKDFNPPTVTFKWTQNGTDLTDFLQYPAVQKNDLYSAVSQIRVKKQDWDDRHPFACTVGHEALEGLKKEVLFAKPVEIYKLPNLKIMTTEADNLVTLSCLANNFVPNVYEFKWTKDGNEINDTTLQFTTPSKSQRSGNGTLYSAASFLTVPSNDLRYDSKLTCKFNLGRGQKQITDNTTHYHNPTENCAGIKTGSDEYKMNIIHPTMEDMLYHRSGRLSCELKNVKDARKVLSLEWRNEGDETLVNATNPSKEIIGGYYTLDLDVTFDEWNRNIKRTCVLHHQDEPDSVKRIYERRTDAYAQKPPSVFMLTPLKHTRDDKVTLTCYIKDFYPKEIYVTWLIDDKETMHEFNTTNSVKSNGVYYTYSHLTIPMGEWDVPEQVYSCLVYHESLDQNRHIVRSITQHSSEQTTMVNLNMKVPDMCKA